eukprot:1721437-Pyramimonas_sp.AAC.1
MARLAKTSRRISLVRASSFSSSSNSAATRFAQRAFRKWCGLRFGASLGSPSRLRQEKLRGRWPDRRVR